MPAPTSYTELALAQYLHVELGPIIAGILGWQPGVNDAGSYQEAVNSTLLVYGVDTIDLITGREAIAKLRCLARVELWRAVALATAGEYDTNADGAQLSRSQIHTQALTNLKVAEGEARVWNPAYQVRIRSVSRDDAYAPPTDEELGL